jgi:hypothetical protein
MSYCVNCGVELGDAEKACPLCNVEVQNPNKPWVEPAERPYSQRVDKLVETVDRKFGVWLASLFLLIPAAVTLISDLLTSFRISWSAYVIGACLLVYFIVLFPLLFKKPKPHLFVGVDIAATLAFLYLINYITGGANWFWPLAMPITLIGGGFTFLVVFMLRLKDYPDLYKVAAILSSVGILCVSLEVVLNAFFDLSLAPSWSLFAVSPCIILSVMMVFTERHKTLKEKIRRRLFY